MHVSSRSTCERVHTRPTRVSQTLRAACALATDGQFAQFRARIPSSRWRHSEMISRGRLKPGAGPGLNHALLPHPLVVTIRPMEPVVVPVWPVAEPIPIDRPAVPPVATMAVVPIASVLVVPVSVPSNFVDLRGTGVLCERSRIGEQARPCGLRHQPSAGRYRDSDRGRTLQYASLCLGCRRLHDLSYFAVDQQADIGERALKVISVLQKLITSEIGQQRS
jgi:hypothetical protein